VCECVYDRASVHRSVYIDMHARYGEGVLREREEKESTRSRDGEPCNSFVVILRPMLSKEPMFWRPNEQFQHDDFSIKNCAVSTCVTIVSETDTIHYSHIPSTTASVRRPSIWDRFNSLAPLAEVTP